MRSGGLGSACKEAKDCGEGLVCAFSSEKAAAFRRWKGKLPDPVCARRCYATVQAPRGIERKGRTPCPEGFMCSPDVLNSEYCWKKTNKWHADYKAAWRERCGHLPPDHLRDYGCKMDFEAKIVPASECLDWAGLCLAAGSTIGRTGAGEGQRDKPASAD
jgi:hypothetical protein